jgi:hypothetical protein
MGDFGAIVSVAFRVVSHRSQGGRVASELVGPSKESFRGALITARLSQDSNQVAVLTHGTPQIRLLAGPGF